MAGYGYLHKVRVGDAAQLLRALREVAAGGSALDPRIVETLLRRPAREPGPAIITALGPTQAGIVIDHIHSSGAGRVEPLSLLLDVGLLPDGGLPREAGT